jgi:preprotein translocase subunit SecE
MGRMKDFQLFIEDVQAEVKRVTWPDQVQVRNATAVILVFVFILAIIIGAMDAVFSATVRGVVGVFGG